AKMMKESMESMGPVRLKDVEEAQQSLVAITKDLADRGEITIVTAAEDDELIF
ncbi:MAG: flagellar motor switch protein FliG, partial [Proteobacteria bacterium]|nr:flagellar motor switch protein FliG [Pseudomonadota bacterium]